MSQTRGCLWGIFLAFVCVDPKNTETWTLISWFISVSEVGWYPSHKLRLEMLWSLHLLTLLSCCGVCRTTAGHTWMLHAKNESEVETRWPFWLPHLHTARVTASHLWLNSTFFTQDAGRGYSAFSRSAVARVAFFARDCSTDITKIKCFKCDSVGHIGANCKNGTKPEAKPLTKPKPKARRL